MRLRLFGREVLPAHLSARLPAAPHAHTQMRTCIWLVMRTQKKSFNRQGRAHEDSFSKCNKGLIDHILKLYMLCNALEQVIGYSLL